MSDLVERYRLVSIREFMEQEREWQVTFNFFVRDKPTREPDEKEISPWDEKKVPLWVRALQEFRAMEQLLRFMEIHGIGWYNRPEPRPKADFL